MLITKWSYDVASHHIDKSRGFVIAITSCNNELEYSEKPISMLQFEKQGSIPSVRPLFDGNASLISFSLSKDTLESKQTGIDEEGSITITMKPKESKDIASDMIGEKELASSATVIELALRNKSSQQNNSHNWVLARRPVNDSPRNAFNDIYLNIKNVKRMNSVRKWEYTQYHTLLYYEGSIRQMKSNETTKAETTDVTFISQMTIDRLNYIPFILQRWKGPISIAIMVRRRDLNETELYIQNHKYPSRLRLVLYVYHYKGHKDQICHSVGVRFKCEKSVIYPINRLRNYAIQNSITSHFALFDMDLWPSKSTYESLLALPPEYMENPYSVTIIPAFSVSHKIIDPRKCKTMDACIRKTMHYYPEKKEDLVACMKRKECTTFRPDSLTHDYLVSSWYQTMNDDSVFYINCFRQRFLEPYVMVKKTSVLPFFDERFINYGFNKVQWIEDLRYRGFEFSILSKGYAIDMPHPPSPHSNEFTRSFMEKNVEMLNIYRLFLFETRYRPDESRQLLCLDKRKTSLARNDSRRSECKEV